MITWIFILVGCSFVAITLGNLYFGQWAQRLPLLSEPPLLDRAPSIPCSVVIAAQNEEARIAETIKHLLAQKFVTLEIIVVNDRSEDGTEAVLDELQRAGTNIKIIHNEILPEGWLGKCHACHLGAQKASGDWILFVDADCWLEPSAVARAWQITQLAKVQHITLTPGVRPKTIAAAGWHLAFLFTLSDWFMRVNRDAPKGFLGFGAFNFIKREVYEAVGGYVKLRMTVVDDMKLGKLVRERGFRSRAFVGGDDALCQWGTTCPEMIKIMEKNYFAAIDYKTFPALTVSLGFGFWCCLGLFGWVTMQKAGLFATIGTLSLALPGIAYARKLQWPWYRGLALPFLFPLLLYALFNSTRKTLSQKGIKWRNSFYSLDELRRGNIDM